MQIHIHLFGEFELWLDDQPVALKGHKNQALVAWLAAGIDRMHPRDRLVGLLWGDHSQANARTSLRQALSVVRRVLPTEILRSEADSLGLSSTSVVVDVMEFSRLSRASDTESRWQASEIYDGELLDGFRSRAEPFDEWLQVEREAYRRQAIDLMENLLETPEISADADRAIKLCGRLLAADPLAEHIYRRLMRLYAEIGHTGSALRQFRLCEEVLQRELSSPPAMATVQLMQSIKDGQLSTSTAEKPTPSATANASGSGAAVEAVDRRAQLPSVAVLPFASMSSDPEHGYLADGMTEELINLLANCENWRVTSRNASFKYKGKNVDLREVGTDLGVNYVVEGSIRRVGQRIRVTAQLISTQDGTHIWSDRYDRALDEIFDVQDEVVHAIYRVLRNRIGFAERERVRRTQNANLDAWGLLIKASQVRLVDRVSRQQQHDLIREALAIDPGYPRAHAYLASALFLGVARGYSRDLVGDFAQAEEHADAALTTGETDLVVLRMCAAGYASVGTTDRALQLAERAYQLSGTPTPLLAAALMWSGRIDEAEAYCDSIISATPEGISSNPGELRPIALKGNLLLLKGSHEAAYEYSLQDLRANPGNYFSHINVANLHGLLGRHQEALAHWKKAQELSPGLTFDTFCSGYDRVMAIPGLAKRFSEGLALAGVH